MGLKLTPEQIAQVMAGNTEIEGIELPPAQAAATTPAPAAPTTPAVTQPAATTAPVDTKAELIAYLQTQLAEANSGLVTAKVEIATLKKQAEDAQAALPDLLKIAQGVVGNMQIALGASDTSAALGAKDVVAEHGRLSPVYTEKFKVGGIAAVRTEEPAKAEIHPLFAQRLATAAAATK